MLRDAPRAAASVELLATDLTCTTQFTYTLRSQPQHFRQFGHGPHARVHDTNHQNNSTATINGERRPTLTAM